MPTRYIIFLNDENRLIRQHSYRAWQRYREVLWKHIYMQLEKRVIKSVQSECASIILLVPKRMKFLWFFRLSAPHTSNTIPDTDTLPLMNDLINCLWKDRVFAGLDPLWNSGKYQAMLMTRTRHDGNIGKCQSKMRSSSKLHSRFTLALPATQVFLLAYRMRL